MVKISEVEEEEHVLKPTSNEFSGSESSCAKMNKNEGIVALGDSPLKNDENVDNDEEEDDDDDHDDNSVEDSSDEIDTSNEDAMEDGDSYYSDNEESEQIKPTGMDIVKNVLERAAKEAEKNESISVAKPLDLEYDLGTLLAIDTNEMDSDLLRDSTEEYLKNLARDNTQLLVNHIWELPITRKENEIVAKLPPPSFRLPREKPAPKPKPLTKWQQFALEKGIQKKKRPKVQWDETLQKWIPWWGYKRTKAEREKSWVIEAKQNEDPMEDPFAKRAEAKQERVAKNELQRMRNLARANNVKIPREDTLGEGKKGKNKKGQPKLNKKGEPVPRMGLLTPDKMNSSQLKQAVAVSKFSTASVGKFQSRLPKEKERSVGALLPIAKKRRAPFLKPEEERKANLDIIDNILKKRPKLDLEKAVNRHINQEEKQRAEEKSQKPKGKGREKARGKGKGNRKGKGLGKVKMSGKGGKGGGKQKRGKKR
ncbi:hypothetical protein R5R35_006137 [Gryllus longicercus]|uniref:Ribosome biogenesis regulatory protein n=1 Tax=Gryllus longicercus TaxID=2509291 RepID=A0AAN9VLU7_9ORTH